MAYQGFIKKSRTLDLTAVSQVVDAMAATFLTINPQDLHITVAVYAVARIAINGLQAWLRYKTTGPVGQK